MSTCQPLFLECFDQQCLRLPRATAVEHGHESLTYDQLSQLSDRAVSALRSRGIQPGQSIGLLCERSFTVIAMMIACFRTGAAFVPLDPAYPDARLRYMLDDASVVCVVVDSKHQERLSAITSSKTVSRIDLSCVRKCVPCPEKLRYMPGSTERAYIMYTSGSTGKPKGVPIAHGALACYCHADIQTYRLSDTDRTLQFATLSFDISIEEIFPSLMTGATVVLRPFVKSAAQVELNDIIATHQISALHLATGYWHEWVDLMLSVGVTVPHNLRLLVVTGDKACAEHYARWQTLLKSTILWVNAYGPTETTVSATTFIPPPGWSEKVIPIGKPLPGYSAHILNENGLPVSAQEIGELCIGGDALAEGYLNRPELTAEKFVRNPFSLSNSHMYRTGDLAHWQVDGNIVCIGRIDSQVKIGSYRVEPGEIESVLSTYPGVDEALVRGEDMQGALVLVAYVASGDSSISANTIADYIKKQLPANMLPARITVLDKLPKTLNGKVDRDANFPQAMSSHTTSDTHSPPTTDLERTLCTIWAETLGHSRIGIDDSFIDLGGNSLMAVRLIARLHSKLNIVISTRDFFFLDTVSLLASHLDGKAVVRQVPSPQPFFINTLKRQLYTVLQQPAKQRKNGRGILLIAPFGNEQRRVQRPLRNVMQNFSRGGYTLLRFDWHGTGNSSGNSSQLGSIDSWHEDVKDSARLLSEYVDFMDIISIRTGALIAANVDWGKLPTRNHIYLEPVLNGEHWLREMEQLQGDIRTDTFRFLKPRRARQDGMFEFAGLTLSPQMKQSIATCNSRVLSQTQTNEFSSHVIVPNTCSSSKVSSLNCPVHFIDEHNDWLSARATAVDMKINEAGQIINNILNGDVRTGSQLELRSTG